METIKKWLKNRIKQMNEPTIREWEYAVAVAVSVIMGYLIGIFRIVSDFQNFCRVMVDAFH